MTSGRPAEVVTYEGLPLSAGGAHSLGRTRPRAAHAAIVRFLETCTAPASRVEHRLVVRQMPELAIPRDDMEMLRTRFGRGDVIVLDDDEVDEAFTLLEDIAPQATSHGRVPIELEMRASFVLLDPSTGEPLRSEAWEERTGYRNDVSLTLGDAASLRLSLCIPLPPGPELGHLVRGVQAHLPCRLSRRHWRSWVIGKGGTSLRPRRLDLDQALG